MCFYLLKRKSRLERTTTARDILKKPSGCKNPSTVLKFAASSSLYDRASQRGLSTTYRQNTAAMAEPHTFYGCCRATNAAHHGGSRARTARAQTRRRGDKGDSGRDGFGHRRAGGGAAGA